MVQCNDNNMTFIEVILVWLEPVDCLHVFEYQSFSVFSFIVFIYRALLYIIATSEQYTSHLLTLF